MKFMVEEVQDSIRLTSNQKAIFATIAQGGNIADDVLASSPNLSGALKQLVKMKMVVNSNDDLYTATDLGKKYAKEAGIIDDAGELTELGTPMVIGSKDTMKESVGTFKDWLK